MRLHLQAMGGGCLSRFSCWKYKRFKGRVWARLSASAKRVAEQPQTAPSGSSAERSVHVEYVKARYHHRHTRQDLQLMEHTSLALQGPYVRS